MLLPLPLAIAKFSAEGSFGEGELYKQCLSNCCNTLCCPQQMMHLTASRRETDQAFVGLVLDEPSGKGVQLSVEKKGLQTRQIGMPDPPKDLRPVESIKVDEASPADEKKRVDPRESPPPNVGLEKGNRTSNTHPKTNTAEPWKRCWLLFLIEFALYLFHWLFLRFWRLRRFCVCGV